MSELQVKTKKAYSEQLRSGAAFYSNLLRFFIASIIIGIITCAYLWFWLYQYERQSVNGALNQFMTDIYNRNWDRIYYDDTRYFQELNTKEAVSDFLLYVAEATEMKPGGCTFIWVEDDGISEYYDVYYRQQKIMTLETYKPERSNTWKVRAVIGANIFDIETLGVSSFRINNIPITEDFSHDSDIVPSAFQGYGLDEKLPTVTQYHIKNQVSEPDIEPERSIDLAVRDHSSNRYYVGTAPTPAQYGEFATEITDTAMAYCEYITEDGTLLDLKKHLLPGTVFYDALNSFDNQWFTTHESVEYQNIELSDILPIGDNAFIGAIKFDYVVTATNVSQTYSNFYQMYFIKDAEGAWKCINIYTVSNSDDTSSLPDVPNIEDSEETEDTPETAPSEENGATE